MLRNAWIAVLAVCAPLGAAEFRAGAAAVRITPPLGAQMAGYYYNRAAEGVHDDLFASRTARRPRWWPATSSGCPNPWLRQRGG